MIVEADTQRHNLKYIGLIIGWLDARVQSPPVGFPPLTFALSFVIFFCVFCFLLSADTVLQK